MQAIERVIRLMISLAVMGRCLPSPVQAQEIIIEPPHPPITWIDGVTVDEQRIDVDIEGRLRMLRCRKFSEPFESVAEGVYLFPLPPDAAVGDFVMKVDGRVLEGVLMPQSRRGASMRR